jgi:hypothetical protein
VYDVSWSEISGTPLKLQYPGLEVDIQAVSILGMLVDEWSQMPVTRHV